MGKDLFKIGGISKLAEPVVNVNSLSRIATGATIKGDIESDTDIRMDGILDGKVRSKGRIVVGENARITGKIFCNALDFWGTVEGDIFVRDVLSLKSSSVVNGTIHVNKFQVEMGAQINGSIRMISEEEYDSIKD